MEEIAFILGLSFGTLLLFGYLLRNYEDNTDNPPEKATTSPPSNRPHTDSDDAPPNPFQGGSGPPEEKDNPEDSDKIICNACGTKNEPSYRFCQNCIEPLIHSRD